MTHHDLKAFDAMFEGFADGSFTSTIRSFEDRDFEEEDTVTLHEGHQETDGFVYSGRKVSFRISAVTYHGCMADHCCLHLKDRNLMIIETPTTEEQQ